MIKNLFVSIFLVVTILTPLGVVSAENVLDPVCQTSPQATVCQENNKAQNADDNSIYGPNGILTRAVQIIMFVIGAVAVMMLIVGGFKYVTSSGDPSNIKSAKDTIIYAIIGLVVAVMAQAIIVFVVGRL